MHIFHTVYNKTAGIARRAHVQTPALLMRGAPDPIPEKAGKIKKKKQKSREKP